MRIIITIMLALIIGLLGWIPNEFLILFVIVGLAPDTFKSILSCKEGPLACFMVLMVVVLYLQFLHI